MSPRSSARCSSTAAVGATTTGLRLPPSAGGPAIRRVRVRANTATVEGLWHGPCTSQTGSMYWSDW